MSLLRILEEDDMAKTPRKLSRRRFLQWLSVGGLAMAAGCGPRSNGSTSIPKAPTASFTELPASITPTRSATRTPKVATATADPRTAVALSRAASYEMKVLRAQWRTMLDGLGGLKGLIQSGARVGLKANLTGGPWWDTPDKPAATELFVTHPAVVGVLCEWLIDAGAGPLYIMDGIADESSWDKWGYTEMARPLGAKLINLSNPAPYSSFGAFPVGKQAQVYDQFSLNRLLRELDVFISVAKMKCHSVMGVTLSLKNLLGLTPLYEYMRKEGDSARTALHGSSDYDTRLPRVILDLNGARPIDLAVIDGIITCEAGAGPWDEKLAQIKPGLLVAGTDPVATDAVSTALMGFDPQATSKTLPFTYTDNYLALARDLGLGTNRLDEINVVGGTIKSMRHPFQPV
jgi:uncharacterized protein (DUF362 family)